MATHIAWIFPTLHKENSNTLSSSSKDAFRHHCLWLERRFPGAKGHLDRDSVSSHGLSGVLRMSETSFGSLSLFIAQYTDTKDVTITLVESFEDG